MKVAKLHNTIQNFAWGSETYLPELLGYANDRKQAQAELWMGVHLGGESYVEGVAVGSSGRMPLSQYLLDGNGKLDGGVGSETAAKYQSLPFLFKVLAAKQPLSIQAHPNKVQAEQGFARENQRAIALDDPQRNYKDPNHKPEIALALTPFWALCGFRPMAEIQNYLGHLADTMFDFTSHQSFFSSLMQLDGGKKTELLERVLQSQEPGRYPKDVLLWVRKLTESYPGDLGALAPLYLNLLCLEPGQAIFLPAGVLHAYLEGSVVELMANSDNVLRGGLTPKHQDLPELLQVLLFEEFPIRVIEARKMDLHRSYYPSPAAEFRLERWCLHPADSSLYFPQKHPVMLAFVYRGQVEINGLLLKQGQSCIIPVSSGELNADVRNGEEAILYVAAAKDI